MIGKDGHEEKQPSLHHTNGLIAGHARKATAAHYIAFDAEQTRSAQTSSEGGGQAGSYRSRRRHRAVSHHRHFEGRRQALHRVEQLAS